MTVLRPWIPLVGRAPLEEPSLQAVRVEGMITDGNNADVCVRTLCSGGQAWVESVEANGAEGVWKGHWEV